MWWVDFGWLPDPRPVDLSLLSQQDGGENKMKKTHGLRQRQGRDLQSAITSKTDATWKKLIYSKFFLISNRVEW